MDMTRLSMAESDRTVLPASAAPAPLACRSVAVMAGVLPVADAIIVLAADICVSVALDDGTAGGVVRQFAAAVVGTGLFVGMAGLAGQYRAENLDRRIGALGPLTATWALALMLTITIAYLWDGGVAVPRAWTVGWFVTGGGALLCWRLAAAARMRRWREDGRLAERVAVIGSADHARRLVEHLAQPGLEGQVAVLGVYDAGAAPRVAGCRAVPVNGCLDDLLRDAPGLGLDAVMIALPWSDPDHIGEICLRLRDLPVDVRLAPDLAAYDLPTGAPRSFAGRHALEVWGRPLRDWRGLLKRAEDLAVGGGLVVLFAPVMLLTALAIRMDSPGPVMLRQRRYGLGNKPIMIFKFRTMHADQGDATGRMATIPGDPRVTRVGRFLRRMSLDELPQLLNVLLGTMSLVGPRAHPVEMQVGGRYYQDIVSHYAARHRMKPGITGLAQINGYRGLVDTVEKAQRRLDYDLQYVEHWSVAMDLRILTATIFRGFTSGGAY